MTDKVCDSFLDDCFHGNITLSSDTIYGMLLTSSYAPNPGTDQKRSDIEANEAAGTGYTAGGAATTVTLTKDTSGHKETVAFAAISWTTATITARRIAYYKHRGGASSADNLISPGDFGSNVTSSGGTFVANNTTPITYQS